MRNRCASAAWCRSGRWQRALKREVVNRHVVILERADWLAWLDLTKPEPELLRPLPAGSLTVEQVR
jgi:putative SOS response-associated peptidase YedK